MATPRKAAGKEVEASAPAEVEVADLKELNRQFGIEDTFVPDSVEDLDEYFEAQGGIITIQGSDYTLLSKNDKDKLVDRPFVIVDTRFYESKQFGNDVVAVSIMTREPINGETRFIFNDGSSGVCKQLKGVVAKAGRRGGFDVPKGLRASHYEYTPTDFDGNPIGEPIQATTYYIQ